MTFRGELYPFQQEAVDRMIEREKLLVAYVMGAGKTVIAIACIEKLIEDGEVGGGLIIVPASLKYQWRNMIKKFTGDAITLVIDGSPQQRQRQYKRIAAGEIEYAIMTYDNVWRDWQTVRDLPRDFVIGDEITAIKGFTAKRSKAMKRMQARYLFGLTGQPIENKAEEVFSIMQWIDPSVLGRWDIFERAFIVRNYFGGVKYYKQLPLLHELLEKAMVRKSREDIADQLPDVVEENVLIEFDTKGARLYKHIATDLMGELSAVVATGNFNLWAVYHGDSEGNEARGRIMSRLTCLRMLCDHPELLRVSAARFKAGLQGGTGVTGGSVYAADLDGMGKLAPLIHAPKFDATMEVIDEILTEADENKVVLFSFFKPTLTLLQQALAKVDVQSVQFTGDMDPRAREAAKIKFQEDPDVRVFLSSDAGGYGVDLPQANYLINYDLPWSAGKLDQRNARIIRLSSEFETITLINMLMAGSIEERFYDLLAQKQAIASAVIDGKGIDQKGRLNLDLVALSQFLTESSV